MDVVIPLKYIYIYGLYSCTLLGFDVEPVFVEF